MPEERCRARCPPVRIPAHRLSNRPGSSARWRVGGRTSSACLPPPAAAANASLRVVQQQLITLRRGRWWRQCGSRVVGPRSGRHRSEEPASLGFAMPARGVVESLGVPGPVRGGGPSCRRDPSGARSSCGQRFAEAISAAGSERRGHVNPRQGRQPRIVLPMTLMGHATEPGRQIELQATTSIRNTSRLRLNDGRNVGIGRRIPATCR